MKTITTVAAVLVASIFITACGKKDEAPAEVPPAATAAPAEAAPADAAPADAAPAATPETNPDAPATGGDKVAPKPN